MLLPVTGHPLHTRSLTMVVTQVAEGRWRARGDVIDLRKCGFVPMVADLQPAGIIHEMSIDLEVDPASRRIESLETQQPFVAIEPSERTGGECCRDPAPRLQALVGETLDAGFAKKLSGVFSGPLGCSHLLTLFQLMASALPHALDREEELAHKVGAKRQEGERIFWRSTFVDGYEVRDGSIELTVQLHDVHALPQAVVGSPLERFHRHEEARVLVRVEHPGLALRDLQVAERNRDADTLASAEWVDHSERVASLEGTLIIPGLARRVFGLLGVDPDARRQRDALLQLAPGFIQVMAAITDRWFSKKADDDATATIGGGAPVNSLGGMADSCYMWRTGGRLGAARSPAR